MDIWKKTAALATALALCAALGGCMDTASSSGSHTGETADSLPAASEPAASEAPDTGSGLGGEDGMEGGTEIGGDTGAGGADTSGGAANGSNGINGDAGNGIEAGSTARAAEGSSLSALLDNCISYEADTAGGSLKTAKAAADLVALLSREAPADLSGEATAWRQGLDAGQEATLQQNWPGISLQARAIADDPAGTADLLATAGVTTDFTGMDLGDIGGCMDTLDEAFRAQK